MGRTSWLERGGIIVKEEIAQSIRVSHWNKIIIFYGDEDDDTGKDR